MDIKPISLHEKLRIGVLLVPMIEKYKQIHKNLRFLQFSEKNWLVLLHVFVMIYIAHSAAERAHFLAIVTSLAT